ncbi:MAG: FMN-binding protein [Defluviitaleaceae bacterium]|nr:FMN-binding protein [Defluviitaleaceae bacterium]
MKKKILGAFMAVAALGVVAACSRPVPPPEVGEFSATAQGFNDWVGVELIVEDGRIVDIIVDWNQEDIVGFVDNIYTPTNRWIVNEVIERQGTAGIVVSGTGATMSANAFLNAVNQVLETAGIGTVGAVEEPEAVDPDDFVPRFGFGDNVEVVTGWAYSPDPRGSGMTDRGNQPIAVQVNFAPGNERIESIEVDFNLETEMFVNFMHPSIVNQIIERQSTEGINTSTGATVTSEAVIEAVQAILDRFNFVAPEIVEEPYEEEPYEDENGDEEPTTEPDDEPAPADEPPPAADEPTAPAGRFTPGTFTGTSNNTYSHRADNEGGYSPGPLVVEVVFSADAVVSFSVVSTNDGAPWVGMATGGLSSRIVGATNPLPNTLYVDTIGGATYTSFAVLEAVNNAINAASN